jgi:hypothetical protein
MSMIAGSKPRALAMTSDVAALPVFAAFMKERLRNSFLQIQIDEETQMSRGSQIRTKKRGARKNRKIATEKPDLGAQQHGIHPIITGPTGQVKYGSVLREKLHEFKAGRLRNPTGKLVTRRNQAVNIARREARMAGARNVPVEGKAEKTKALEARKQQSDGLKKPPACVIEMPRRRMA